VLTKVLITTLIIVLAMFYLKNTKQKSFNNVRSQDAVPSKFRYLSMLLLSLSLLFSAVYLFWQYQEDNKVINVTVISPVSNKKITYHVKRKDISANKIITLEGITIRLSNQERIIIAEAEIN
jgi:hypothetical protein